MHIPSEIQLTTLANMLYTELKKQGIEVCEDQDDRDNILLSSAEHLIYFVTITDIQTCVEEIKDYIRDTLINYPKYFVTGEES